MQVLLSISSTPDIVDSAPVIPGITIADIVVGQSERPVTGVSDLPPARRLTALLFLRLDGLR